MLWWLFFKRVSLLPYLAKGHWSVRNATAKGYKVGLMSPDISREHMMSGDSVIVCVVKG